MFLDSSPQNCASYQFFWNIITQTQIINVNASLWHSKMASFRMNEGILVQICNIHILVTIQVTRIKFGTFPYLFSINAMPNFMVLWNHGFQAPIICPCLMWNFPHIFDWYYKNCSHFFLKKYIVVQSTFSVCDKNYTSYFDSYSIKVIILSFLVIHFCVFCCNKMFSVSRLYFFFTLFLCCMCYCMVSTYFEIAFNNLPNKQMKTSGNNNLSVTIKWKLFCLNHDAKGCKHYTFTSKIYKSLVKESRRLHTKHDWPQWATCCSQS